MYLSYTGFKKKEDCPRAYWHEYIAKTKPEKPDNRVHMLYGETVGQLIETFYNFQLWKLNPTETLLQMVRETMRKIIAKETKKGGIFDWNEPDLKDGTRSFEEVEQEVRDTIPRALESIRKHHLVGTDSIAEMVLDIKVAGHQIAGRCDVVLHRPAPYRDLVIIDGKGSRWRDRYVSYRQLLWYSMLYWQRFRVLPDRVGFIFWRFDPDKSMDWSEVTLQAVENLQRAVVQAIKDIEAGQRELVQLATPEAPGMVFWANPGSDCKLCKFRSLCPEGQKVGPPKGAAHGVEEGDFSF